MMVKYFINLILNTRGTSHKIKCILTYSNVNDKDLNDKDLNSNLKKLCQT